MQIVVYSLTIFMLNFVKRIINIKFIRFLFVGSINTLLSFLIFSLLYYIGLHYFIATTLNLAAGMFISFNTHKHITFSSSSNKYNIYIGFALVFYLITNVLLYFADKVKVKKKLNTKLGLKTVIIIGCFQILSLIPGVSRSGIVITASRFLQFDRYDSTKISFYLSIPVIAGASFLGLKDLYKETAEFNSMIIFTVFFSYFFSYFTIKYFLIFVKKFDLKLFVIYRILLSILLFGIIYF